MNPQDWLLASINTRKAWPLTTFLARRYGRRVEGRSKGGDCVAYWWLGKPYMTDYVITNNFGR